MNYQYQRYQRYRRIFWGTLAAALIVDTSFDFMAMRQASTNDQTGAAVAYSYSVLKSINEIEISLRDNLEARTAKDKVKEQESVTDLVKNFADYKRKILDNPAEQEIFEEFNFLEQKNIANKTDLVESHFDDLSLALADAKNIEESVLVERIKSDEISSNRLEWRMYAASFIDFILIFLVGGIWFIYDRARRKDQSVLSEAIAASQKSNAELRLLLERRSQKLRNTIHDLKNPLGSIKGFSDLITEERYNPESVIEMSQTIQRISAHTLEMVNSLVESEKMASSSDKWLPMDLIHCIDDVCQSLKPQIQSKNQILKISHEAKELQFRGDERKLWDVFMNLVGNATKYSPENSIIEVRTKIKNGKIKIEVEDEGPGFSEADKEKAFLNFQRLSAIPTGGEHSSGLGLSISKQIIEAHSGSIHILDGKNGSGALLVVEL